MIAITNAKVVLEYGVIWNGVLLIDGNKIVSVGKDEEINIPDSAQIYDAKGLYVGPGFVDIHVHGGNGHLLCKSPESGAEHFLRHGETTLLPALYYDLSQEEFLDCINHVREAMIKDTSPIAGIYMEGPYMNPKYGAAPEKNKWRGQIKQEEYMPIIKEAGNLAKVWAVAPEREGVEEFMRDAQNINPGVMFSVGHSEATPAQIQRLKKYGIGLQTHCMNATGRPDVFEGTRSCGPDEACMMDRDMYAEIICDSNGIHVPSDLIRMVISTKGIDRIVLITDCTVSPSQSPEEYRHISDLNFDENGGLYGSNLTMDVACRNFMSHTNCGIAQAFLAAARNPARVIKMDDKIGTIEAGKLANLVFIDDMFNVQKVMLNGRFC